MTLMMLCWTCFLFKGSPALRPGGWFSVCSCGVVTALRGHVCFLSPCCFTLPNSVLLWFLTSCESLFFVCTVCRDTAMPRLSCCCSSDAFGASSTHSGASILMRRYIKSPSLFRSAGGRLEALMRQERSLFSIMNMFQRAQKNRDPHAVCMLSSCRCRRASTPNSGSDISAAAASPNSESAGSGGRSRAFVLVSDLQTEPARLLMLSKAVISQSEQVLLSLKVRRLSSELRGG